MHGNAEIRSKGNNDRMRVYLSMPACYFVGLSVSQSVCLSVYDVVLWQLLTLCCPNPAETGLSGAPFRALPTSRTSWTPRTSSTC